MEIDFSMGTRGMSYKKFYPNGDVAQLVKRDSDDPESNIVVGYFENQNKQYEYNYAEGAVKAYYENGNLRSEGGIVSEEYDGMLKSYTEDGSFWLEENYRSRCRGNWCRV